MDWKEKHEFLERFAKWPLIEQVTFIEDLAREMRMAYTDHAAMKREMEEMAADPDMQRVLRNEDLTGPSHAAG